MGSDLTEGPGDGEVGVVPEDGALAGGVVAAGGFVEDLGVFGKHEEAVGEAFGDPEHFQLAFGVVGTEVKTGPLAEVGRVAAEVDGDVPDVSREDADEFSLRVTKLVMKAAQNAARGKGLIVLGEGGWEAELGEGVRIEDLGEPSAGVAEALWLHDFHVPQRRIA